MMPARVPSFPTSENLLGLSWHDSSWAQILNSTNVLDYFSERSNPFYDRTCNNETIKMQRSNPDQIVNMTGLEYMLLHVQEPILYVIRKQQRHSPTQTIPVADYYIIAGVVYQAPDLMSVINSRLLTAIFHLQSSFEDIASMVKYHPSKGYSWDIKSHISSQGPSSSNVKKEEKDESASNFQRLRVDPLLGELVRRFPIPVIKPPPIEVMETNVIVKQEVTVKTEIKEEPMVVKEEKIDQPMTSPMKPPPEKKLS